VTLVLLIVLVPVTIHLAYLVWLRFAPDDTPAASQAEADWPRARRMTPPARAIFLWRAALLLTVPFGGAALAVLCLLAAASFMTLPDSPKQEAVR
jgi:hypothetical protein